MVDVDLVMPIDRKTRTTPGLDDAGHASAQAATQPAAVGRAGHAAVSRILAAQGDDVAHMDLGSRLLHAAMYSGHEIEKETLDQLVLGLEIAVPVWIVSHAFGIGEVLDGVALLFSANDIATALEEIVAYFRAAQAGKNEADLRKAGEHFGRAVALVGVAALVSICVKLIAHGAEPHAHAEVHDEHLAPQRGLVENLKNRRVVAEHAERANSLGSALPAATPDDLGMKRAPHRT